MGPLSGKVARATNSKGRCCVHKAKPSRQRHCVMRYSPGWKAIGPQPQLGESYGIDFSRWLCSIPLGAQPRTKHFQQNLHSAHLESCMRLPQAMLLHVFPALQSSVGRGSMSIGLLPPAAPDRIHNPGMPACACKRAPPDRRWCRGRWDTVEAPGTVGALPISGNGTREQDVSTVGVRPLG